MITDKDLNRLSELTEEMKIFKSFHDCDRINFILFKIAIIENELIELHKKIIDK